MAKKTTRRELENLIRLYRNARETVLDTIINFHGVGTKVYANTIYKQLQQSLDRMEKGSAFYVRSVIPDEYRKALDDLYAYFTKNNLLMKAPSAFASIHREAVDVVAREMMYQVGQGLEMAGRQVVRYVNDTRDDVLRTAGLETTGEKIVSGGTVEQMKTNLIDHLQNEGFMTVQYGDDAHARQVPVDVYAGMVARSTTREAGNVARENQLMENGYDLVEMTEHYPTCDVCAMYQGRVYSISGKDKRFPALSTAFSGGYHNVHPNCRHVVVPWIEEMMTDEEVGEAISKSSRPYEDTRDKVEVERYNAQQAKNRQAREDLYQYERYKERLGEAAPKSFNAFRRVKSADDKAWGVLQSQYRGIGYYSKAVQLEPAITSNVTDTAKQVGMKPDGLEYRIKEKQSFLRKIGANYSPDGNEYEVKDILRYTLTSPSEELAGKTQETIAAFAEKGYNTVEIKNYWSDPNNPYNGINTVVVSPEGQRFEVQYHTPESFAMKNGEMHELYEKARLIDDKTSPEYLNLYSKMFDLTDTLQSPPNIKEVKLK